MRKRSLLPLPAWALFAFSGLAAQTAPPAFDAVSIRPNTQGQFVSVGRDDASRLAFQNTTVLRLIQLAYDVQAPTVAGPDWIRNERFDLIAVAPKPMTRAEMLPMLKPVLAERFHMAAHTETRIAPGYALLVDKNGPKMHRVGGDFKCDSPSAHGLAQITGTFDMAQLANSLAAQVDGPVLDATGLQGSFDLCLGFARTDATANATDGQGPAAAGDAPELLTALQQQLGLRLEARTAPVAFLVIDHIERPTPN